MGEEAFGGVNNGDVLVVENKPKRAPPARFANKGAKPTTAKVEEEKKNDIDEKPIIKSSIDDVPIGGIKTNVNLDDIEDKPLPRGTYNLDALGAEAFGDSGASNDNVIVSENNKPKRAPPARFSN